MKRFIKECIVFVSLVIVFVIFIFFQADGYSDPFYLRFTSPRQNAMILGTSRAAQGLQPQIFKEALGVDIYNYSFTAKHSPYGPVYLNSIKKKLNVEGKEELFILAIDPWSISSLSDDPDNITSFRELDGCLANTEQVCRKPNFQYLLNNFDNLYYEILFKDKQMLLHENGWLEISIP